MIRSIEGRHNHSVKLARKLQKKKYRRERGLLVGEGLDLLRIAVDAGADISDVLVRSDVVHQLPPPLLARAEIGVVDIGVCADEIMGQASSLGGSADVIFMCRQPAWSLADMNLEHGVCLYLDGVGDPGNVGTLVRGCVGFGAQGLICSPGTADPFGPKAMRAGMGAQFLVSVAIEVDRADLEARLRSVAAAGGRPPVIWVADPHQGRDIRAMSGVEEAVPAGTEAVGIMIVLGSERTGASDWGSEYERVAIPQVRFDSLNVAMAGTILLYEVSRRQSATSAGPHRS